MYGTRYVSIIVVSAGSRRVKGRVDVFYSSAGRRKVKEKTDNSQNIYIYANVNNNKNNDPPCKQRT